MGSLSPIFSPTSSLSPPPLVLIHSIRTLVEQPLMMTIQAAKFTPEVLLSAPRRSPGVPNATGELVLYTVSEDAILNRLCSIEEERMFHL